MLNYLFKLLFTILFSFLIAYFYFKINPAHIENFDGYLGFFTPLILFYSVYKYFTLTSGNKKVTFSLGGILGYFLVILFISSLFFYGINDFKTIDLQGKYGIFTGIILFIKIIIYSFFPILVTFISIAFGRKILKRFNLLADETKGENGIYNFLFSLGIGFFSFLFFLTIFGFLNFYNLYLVFIILSTFFFISINEIKELGEKFWNYRINFNNHNLLSKSLLDKIALKLLSTEFLFILISIVLSTNLINIVRPMPIGWDDLGVYMNYPRQMALSGNSTFLGGMYSWQLFTGIGYMISEPIQAFFLNVLGGFLSIIVIVLSVSDLLKTNTKSKSLINIPLLLGAIFISMPMIVFQQAKDMKLDEGLFFVSVIILYLVFKLFKKSEPKITLFGSLLKKFTKNKENEKLKNLFDNILDNNNFLTDKKLGLKILFFIGILAGFAFSIKFTSLLLISAIIGLFFYTELGFAGFLGYLGLYFALFTKAKLWNYLNVIYPKDNIEFINYFSFVSLIFGIIFLIIGYIRHKNNLIKLLSFIGVFISGIIISLLPWFAKNIYQVHISNAKISIGTLLSGKQQSFNPDWSKIYTEEQLKEIKRLKEEKSKLTSSGTTNNEDFGRYLGYEKGINNYIKLPWNLTMQINQGGEFTTLGWLFLALIPILFLFLSYKRKGLEYINLIFIFGEILLFIYPKTNKYFTNVFSKINFPEGYIYLFLFFLIPVIFLIFSLKNTKLNNLFKINLIFAFFYVFLFVISAYGIVWYGILMYYSLLLMIGISLYKISSIEENFSQKEKEIKLFGSIIIFSVFLFYFFLSVFPHTFNNLKKAGYPHFKAGVISATDAIFAYHPEYKLILLALNIDADKLLKNKIKFSLKDILNPPKSIQNEDKIYRMGTFLKYYIIGNDHRLLEDALLTTFDTYFYNSISNKNLTDKQKQNLSIERMKKVGLKFLLVDLNAATIDKDPKHNLTKRYENLLKLFTSNKLQLIETDSTCLKLALELYEKSSKSQKDLQEYMLLAGVNYNSYPTENTIIPKNNKRAYCIAKIKNLVENNKVNNSNFPYLKGITDLNVGYKALFKINN